MKEIKNENPDIRTVEYDKFNEAYLELLDHCQMLKGYFNTDIIRTCIGSCELPEELGKEGREAFFGFTSCLDIFCRNMDGLFDKLSKVVGNYSTLNNQNPNLN